MKKVCLVILLLIATQKPAKAFGILLQANTSEMTCQYLLARLREKETVLTSGWIPQATNPKRGTCHATYL